MKLILTEANYHSPEANRKYMSASQFKDFQDCEAKAMAILSGEYRKEPSPSMLVGSYVDAFMSDSLELFRSDHPEIFKRDGSLKAEYEKAEQIMRRIEQDELFMKYLSGEHQVILTGKIENVPFKIKIDSFHANTAIVDLKVMKDMKPMYVPEQGRLSFIEAWRYDLQGAIYQAVEGHNLPFIIAAATKEREPDIELIGIPQHYLNSAIEIVKNEAPRYQAIKQGKIEPIRCGRCDYCRKTKKLTKVISLDEFNEQGVTTREDYDQ